MGLEAEVEISRDLSGRDTRSGWAWESGLLDWARRYDPPILYRVMAIADNGKPGRVCHYYVLDHALEMAPYYDGWVEALDLSQVPPEPAISSGPNIATS